MARLRTGSNAYVMMTSPEEDTPTNPRKSTTPTPNITLSSTTTHRDISLETKDQQEGGKQEETTDQEAVTEIITSSEADVGDDLPTTNELNDFYGTITGLDSRAFHLKKGIINTVHSKRRLVYKNGDCNISHENISKSRRRYLADIFTTLVDIQWRWSFCVFASGFVISWLIFGLVWWIIAWVHGDLGLEDPTEPSAHHLPVHTMPLASASFQPCVAGVNSFTTAFLFSIETQHTIGYGTRASTDECPEAVLLQMIQSCFGVIIQALMTGLVFSKLARPKRRAETLLFSKNAVICQRDGTYCLLFRIGDIRKSHIIEAHVRAYVIKRRVTEEGEIIPMEAYDVNVGYDKGCDRVFLVWPLLVCHEIDETSPFWSLSAHSLLDTHFELVVLLEGILESTGMTAQARSSYLPNEILWGHRFERLTSFHDDHYRVDYARFHCTVPISMPRCSASEYKRMDTIIKVTNKSSNDSPTFYSPKRKRKEEQKSKKKARHLRVAGERRKSESQEVSTEEESEADVGEDRKEHEPHILIKRAKTLKGGENVRHVATSHEEAI